MSNIPLLSIGENCLSDNILSEFKLKSFATPYSHARSNLDNVLTLESINYSGFLDSNNIEYRKVGNALVPYSKLTACFDPIYEHSSSNGFEFTHHDVLKNKDHRESYIRKVNRMISIRGNSPVSFLYHYRYVVNKSIDLLIEKATQLATMYSVDDTPAKVTIFYQHLITNQSGRCMQCIADTEYIKVYAFNTLNVWGGNDPLLRWAKPDYDLIGKMLKEITN